MRLSGSSAESSTQYRAALNLLRDIQKEPGAEHIGERVDLKSVFEEASRWSKSS